MTVLATTTFVPAALFTVDKNFSLLVIGQYYFMPVASKCPGKTFRFAERPARPYANDDERPRRQFPKEGFNGISAEIDVALEFGSARAHGLNEPANLFTRKIQRHWRIVQRQRKRNDLGDNQGYFGFQLARHVNGGSQCCSRVARICKYHVNAQPAGLLRRFRVKELNSTGS